MFKKPQHQKAVCSFLVIMSVLTACAYDPAAEDRSEIYADSSETEVMIDKDSSESADAAADKSSSEASETAHGTVSPESDTVSEDLSGTAETGEEPSAGIDVSMEEAIRIAETVACQYYDDLVLTEIHSYDNDVLPDGEAGSDGKREWWYVNFANEELNYVNVLIKNGKVCDVHAFEENGNNGLFQAEELQLTSSDAVRRAMEAGLCGGDPDRKEEWVSGFHFKVAYGSLVESPDDRRIFFEVIGVSPDRNFAHVDFDGVTGELLLAEEEIEYENGETRWKSFWEK